MKARIPAAAPVGLLLAGLCLTLLLTAYVRLYEAASQQASLGTQLEQALERKAALEAELDAVLEDAAPTLGLAAPQAAQVRTVTLPLRDHGEVVSHTP